MIDHHAVSIISNSMCLTEKITLHRPAWQNSAELSYTGAGRAVDGRFTNLNLDGGQCAASQGGQTSSDQ